jgi:hypothetical protein
MIAKYRDTEKARLIPHDGGRQLHSKSLVLPFAPKFLPLDVPLLPATVLSLKMIDAGEYSA